MAAVHPIEVLERRLRDLLESYESELGEAVDRVTERFSGKIERLVEQFGPQELELNLRYYPITVLPRNLHEAFGPVTPLKWGDEE
jgi:molybdopterin converting factor small subunit